MRPAIGAPLQLVVGGGGVGKTTLAAALALRAARAGRNTLVMTFDPSQRLRDALGVDVRAGERVVPVPFDAPGRLEASLLDARGTFDRLVARYAPDEASRRRILDNRFYRSLGGSLSGMLEYMAVERLYEVSREGCYDAVVLDTPPTREALDFLDAPERIVGFLDSGALRLALGPWFDERGRLRGVRRIPFLGKSVETFLDRVVGLDLLRDMAEFFGSFAPLYAGFRRRALEVRDLLRSEQADFLLVAAPDEESVPDTMFFARKLAERGHRLGAVAVNRVHPPAAEPAGGEGPRAEARRLLHWLGARDRRGLARLRELLPELPIATLPLLPRAPVGLAALEELGAVLEGELRGD